jgi:hypothetical protein
MVNGPAVPVARTVKLPLQAEASELPVGERMEISAERGRAEMRNIKIILNFISVTLFNYVTNVNNFSTLNQFKV